MTFTPEVYEQIREGAKRSARVVVPLVHDLLKPRTVVDVGCGEGWFAREFAKLGCAVQALDESVADRVELGLVYDGPGGGSVTFRHADLTAGDAWAGPSLESDLVVCLEVAEHLSPGAADAFVATLCALSRVVLFSAAAPGQGGHGHLNEQPPAYWAEKFGAHAYNVSGALRWDVWGNDEVEPWYQQNLLVAFRPDAQLTAAAVHHLLGVGKLSKPIHVVHPTTFAYWVEIAKARR